MYDLHAFRPWRGSAAPFAAPTPPHPADRSARRRAGLGDRRQQGERAAVERAPRGRVPAAIPGQTNKNGGAMTTMADDLGGDDGDRDGNDNDKGDAILSALEVTGGVVPSDEWYRSCREQLRQEQPSAPGGCQRRSGEADADAVYAQVLHHDLRSVVDRARPSRAARHLRERVLRPPQHRQPQARGPGSSALLSGQLRLLVQVEDVVDVARSRESRMAVTAGAANAAAVGDRAPPPSTARCLKLQLVDGYSYGDRDADASSRPRHHSYLVAMELSAIPNLSETTPAGTKLLLCLATADSGGAGGSETEEAPQVLRHASRGVLLLTPENCLVVGGHVSELASVQASQRHEARERSGVGTDPTVRALISQNYFAREEDDDDDENHDEREGESRDVTGGGESAGGASAPRPAVPVVAPRPLTLTALIHHSHPPILPANPAQAAARPVSLPAPAGSVPANPYSTSATTRPAPLSRSSVLVSSTNAAAATGAAPASDGGTTTKTTSRTAMISRSGGTAPFSNPYASSDAGRARVPPPSALASSLQSAHPLPTTTPAESTALLGTSTTFGSATSAASVLTGSAFARHAPAAASSSLASVGPPPPAATVHSITPFDTLYGLVKRAARDRGLYDQLRGSWSQAPPLARLVQVPPKISFGIDKIPKRLRSSPGGDPNRNQQHPSQVPSRKHEYALVAKFRGALVTSNDDPLRCIACKLADRVLEPYFAHPADELRAMRKADRATIDEIVLEGGRKLQAWTTREQLYRVKLLLPSDEFFAAIPPHAFDGDSRPVLFLDTP